MKLLSLGILLASALTSFAQPKRPNFLFIYTDDQRWDALGFVQKQQGEKARFPWLQTPNLDKLRSQGAHFSNAFCTTSLCSPSRATFLTGQYAHTHGVTNNHTALPPGTVTYATLLQQAGYATGFVGKWHMGNQPERPGFDFSASFNGQGKFYNCPVTVRKNGEVKQVVAEKWIDDASADFAIGFLKENKDKPFSLTVSFKSVHGPREPEADFKTTYADAKANPVPNLKIASPFRPDAKSGTSYQGENLRDYFRTLTSADRSLGRLLDELDSLGLDKNTVVIFTSDNGYYQGEHSLGDKRSAYEESMRLPFIVRTPFSNVAGKTIDPIILNVDIAPTLLDYAGVAIPKEIQGRSLRPLLEEKPPADWRKSFLYEYFYERNFKNPTILGLRTTTDKIIIYPGREQWNEIYEVDKDPYELTNQFNNPDHADLKKQLLSELERLKQETRFRIPSNVDPDNFGNETPKRGKKADLDL
jgi:arylsulfatase A-like enzyme